jgi:hypothetical protein
MLPQLPAAIKAQQRKRGRPNRLAPSDHDSAIGLHQTGYDVHGQREHRHVEEK